MASSHVEVSSSPFGCVLRDHNRRRRDRERENNARSQAAFQKNLKEFVNDHIHTRISLPGQRDSEAVSNENSQYLVENRDRWGRDNERNVHNFRRASSREDMRVESSAMRRRQSRLLDQWAAQQAREMITTIERQRYEAELLALSNSHPVSTRQSAFLRESSPAPSDTSSIDVPNLRASSLVQMWKEFEAEARSRPRNQPCCINSISRTSSIMSSHVENASSYAEEPSIVGSEFCDSADERYIPEDSYADSESEQAAPCDLPSSSQGHHGRGSERVRVADIIRRLTSGNWTQSSATYWSDENDGEHSNIIEPPPPPHEHSAASERREQLRFPCARNRPRVRGRKAIVDLLMHMERERQRELTRLVERRAVSRFPQRGRIQSLLRLRCLREVAGQDQRHPDPPASERNQMQRRTPIRFLRERFNPRTEWNGGVLANQGDNLRSSNSQIPNNSLDSEHSGISNHLLIEEIHHQEVPTTNQESRALLPTPSVSVNQQEVDQSSEAPWQETSSAVSNLEQQGNLKTATTSNNLEQNIVIEEPNSKREQMVGSTNGTWLNDTSNSYRDQEGCRQARCQKNKSLLSTSSRSAGQQEEADQSSDVTGNNASLAVSNIEQKQSVKTATMSHGWEGNIVIQESEVDEHQVVGSADETLLSDPPTDGESDRQAAPYQEIHENDSENLELQDLLQRRSVTGLLSSDFRITMEQIIISQLQRQRQEEDAEEEEENHIEHQYHEEGGAFDQVASTSLQLPLPSALRSRIWYQDHEASGDSGHIASLSLQHPQVTRSYYQDSAEGSPSTVHQSLEMELIFDLRGHMEQLHHEMSELRKSVECCMNMQLKLQHSIKKDVSSAACHSGQGGEAKQSSNWETIRKGSCCICYEMQVDSLLYRCGHMCTCFKCAHELQWSSGRCPICRAPIIDVVRAYPDL